MFILYLYIYILPRILLTFTGNAERTTIDSFPTNVATSLISNSYWFRPTM